MLFRKFANYVAKQCDQLPKLLIKTFTPAELLQINKFKNVSLSIVLGLML
jgi:hypothetical protein